MKNFVLFCLLSFFIEGVFGEFLSVKEGDSVTLHTGLTEIQKIEDLLEWRFGAGQVRIARVRKDRDPTTYDDVLGGIFRGRLKPDGQTGDLTITNITTEHAGPYEISINDVKKTFSVIVVPADPVKTVSVMVGDSVTLNTDDPDPQRYDVIKWRFKNSPIAEINRKTRYASTSNTDERFRDRLQLDYWTGSLTIRNTETTHSGDYEYVISISNHTIHRSFTVTVSGELKSAQSVKEGGSVTLQTGLTERQTDDFMQWMFGDSQIAEIYKANDRFSTSDGLKGRLKLDHQTGSLIITDTRFTDSGLYELKISSRRRTVLKRITVTVTGWSAGAIAGIVCGVLLVFAVPVVFYHRRKISELILETLIYKRTMLSVMEGEPITLNPDGVHKDDKLLVIFGGSCIAERKSPAEVKSTTECESIEPIFTPHDDVLDGRFKGRLDPDPQNGSLTIMNTRPTDSGVYELLIIGLGKSSINRFRVSVFDQTEIKPVPVTVSVKEGEPVKLETGVANVQEHDEIQWKFGLETLLAEIKRGTNKILPFAGEIFQGRLELDHQTGSLTIKKIRPTDAGIYKLDKIEEGKITAKLFRVKVLESTDNRNNPKEKSVTRNNPEENEPFDP